MLIFCFIKIPNAIKQKFLNVEYIIREDVFRIYFFFFELGAFKDMAFAPAHVRMCWP